MYAQFRYLDGPLAGQTKIAGRDFVTIGRHPNSDVPFDPTRDLDVSIRHAAVFRQGGGFMVRDLGSTNGTFLNGTRVRGDRPIEPGDVLKFGPEGPQIEFTVVETPPHFVAAARGAEAAELAQAPNVVPTSSGLTIHPPRNTTQRVRAEVRRQTGPWKAAALVALLAAAAVAGWFGYQRNRDRQQLENERAILLGRIDGLLAELKASHVNLANLSEALGQSETEVNQLRELVAANDVSRDRFSALKQQVDSSLGHQTQLLKAVALDLKTITAGIGPAAGVVLAQFGDNQVISGSGFALSAAGDTVWFATNRHVVTDSAGAPAPRLGVIFNGTAQNFRAELARASDSADVAVLKVVLRGGAPVVQKTADRAAVGDPVAIIGFPNGIDASSQAKWRTAGVNAATFAGTLTEVTGDRLTIDGYGTHGSSGSAVVNGAGEVIGMVFGGERDSNGRVVYAIPIRMVVGSR